MSIEKRGFTLLAALVSEIQDEEKAAHHGGLKEAGVS